MVQPSIFASLIPQKSTSLFSTGLDPGIPRQVGHTWVLGAGASVVGQEQNILDLVGSCTWISNPIFTGSPPLS